MDDATEAPMNFNSADPSQIDLRGIWQIFRRRAKIFGIVAAIVFLIPTIYVLTLPNVYTATSTVLIERRSVDVTDSKDVLSEMPGDSAAVDTEVQRLNSLDLVNRVIDRLNLTQNAEVMNEVGSRGLFGGANPVSRETVTEWIKKNLDVERKGLTYAIDVNFSARSPELASTLANAFATEYLASQRELKLKVAADAAKFLEQQRSDLGQEANAKQQAASNIRARTGIPDSDRLTTYDEQSIAQVSSEAIQAASELADKRARLASAQRARGNPSALPEVLSSQVIRDLRSQRAVAAAKVADLSSRYGSEHPELATAKGQVREIDSEIAGETSRIIAGLSADVGAAQQKLAVLQGALAAQRGRSVANAQASVAVKSFDSDAQVSRDLYETFSRRAKEALAAKDLASPDSTIVGVATPPDRPSSPKRMLLILLAAIASAVAGVLAVIIAEMLDIKLSNGSDVRRHLRLPVLASIPIGEYTNEDQQALGVVEAPYSRFSESYRTLSASVMSLIQPAAAGQAEGRTIMVTSSLPHDGKTTVAGALALSIAESGKRVLLLDTDLRRPRVLDAMGCKRPQIGLADVLLDGGNLANAITQDAAGKVHILPVRERNRGLECLQDGRMADLLTKLRGMHDYVVIDTPPLLATSEAHLISTMADAVVFVVRWRKTSRNAAKAAISTLKAANAPLLGVVLNHVDLKLHSLYSQDDALAYYGSYQQYYSSNA